MALIHDAPNLRGRKYVFKDRDHAGEILLSMLKKAHISPDTTVLGIPSGGVPIAMAIANGLKLPLDLIIIKKIPVPGNPEAGIGALTLWGQIFLNQPLIERLRLTPAQIEAQIARVRNELKRRNEVFRGNRPAPALKDRNVIIADDGLASGFTALAAARAVRDAGAGNIIMAVPTASDAAIERLADEVDEIFCPNIRRGYYFAVADAYENWYDLSEGEVLSRLAKYEKAKKMANP